MLRALVAGRAALRLGRSKLQSLDIIDGDLGTAILRAVELANEAVFVTDCDGRILYANRAFERLTGYDFAEVRGKTPAVLKSGQHGEAFYADMWRTLKAGETWQGRVHNRRADGMVFVAEATLVPVADDEGVQKYIALLRDLSHGSQAERALAASEARLLEVQRVARLGHWHWNLTSKQLSWSPEVFEIFGLDAAQVAPSYDDFVALVHPEDRGSVEAAVRAALQEGKSYDVVHRILTPAGEERILRERAEVVRSEDGGAQDMLGTVQDVTAWELTQRELRVRDKAMAASQSAIALADGDGVLTYVNDAFLRLWKAKDRSRVLGRHATEFWSDPEGAHGVIGSLVRDGRWAGELQGRRDDGSSFEVEVLASLTYDGGGRPEALMASFVDVTERKQAQRQHERFRSLLAAAAEEWRVTFDVLDFPMLALDETGRVRRLNREAQRALGRNFDDVLGHRLGELNDAEPWRTLARLVDDASGAESTVAKRRVGRREANGVWDVEMHRVVAEGERAGWSVVLVRDVADMVALEASLRHSEVLSAMGALVAGVAHEVRNPLFGISAALDAFEARYGEAGPYERFIEVLRSQVVRMTDLMQALLDYGRPDELRLERRPIVGTVRAGVELCETEAARAGVAVAVSVAEGLAPVAADHARLTQVIHNLVHNAVAWSPPGGDVRVDVAARSGNAAVELVVTDAGPGFPPDCLTKAFDPFFSRRSGGTGLGLSIVDKIVRAHGGRVWAENGADRGARVHVLLPNGEPRDEDAGA